MYNNSESNDLQNNNSTLLQRPRDNVRLKFSKTELFKMSVRFGPITQCDNTTIFYVNPSYFKFLLLVSRDDFSSVSVIPIFPTGILPISYSIFEIEYRIFEINSVNSRYVGWHFYFLNTFFSYCRFFSKIIGSNVGFEYKIKTMFTDSPITSISADDTHHLYLYRVGYNYTS